MKWKNQWWMARGPAICVALLLATAASGTGCSRDAVPVDGENKPAVDHQSEPAANVQAMPPAGTTSAAPSTITISTAGNFESGFAGAAREFMRARALPASQDLKDDVADLVRQNREIGGCRPSANQNQAHLVDTDNDGEHEALAIYTFEACGGPQYATRVLAILRQTQDRKWVPVLERAISVKAGDRRAIVSIGDGTVTLAGEGDGFGGTTAPEVIDIPTRNPDLAAVP